MTDHPNVVGQGDLEWGEQSHGQRFGYRRKQLGATAGGRRVGCSLYEVPPGRAAFPRHYHLANEEAIYVLEGSGTLRIGRRGEEVEVSEGDYVALPVGADWSHQLLNTSGAKLRYLCFSTMVEPDVMIYPDSGKVGIFGGAATGGPKEERTFSRFLRGGRRGGLLRRRGVGPSILSVRPDDQGGARRGPLPRAHGDRSPTIARAPSALVVEWTRGASPLYSTGI